MIGVRVNDEVEIVGLKEEIQKALLLVFEIFRKQLDEGIAGDNVSVAFVVSNVMKSNVVKCAPGSINPTLNSRWLHLSKKRWTSPPFFNSFHRPTVLLPRTTDVGSIELPAGTEMVILVIT